MSRIVFLHGFTGGKSSWARLEQLLPLPAVSFDLPGHGPSPNPEEAKDTRALGLASRRQRFSRSIHQIVETLEPQQDLLVGYSMGARVALGMLIECPKRFAGAVLIGGQPGLEHDAEADARYQEDSHRAARIERLGLNEFIKQWEAHPLFAGQQQLPAAVVEQQLATRLANTPHGLASALRQLGLGSMPNYWPRLTEVQVPTHLVVGGQDDKFCRIARRMRQRLPHAKLSVLPGAGHNPLLSHPETIAKLLLEEWNRCLK